MEEIEKVLYEYVDVKGIKLITPSKNIAFTRSHDGIVKKITIEDTDIDSSKN
tara:strand:+ start:303 stop:458 length:156 start_codon:yes stop_codon:yes gene_type:complete